MQSYSAIMNSNFNNNSETCIGVQGVISDQGNTMATPCSDSVDYADQSVLSVTSSNKDNVSRCHVDGSSGEGKEDPPDHAQPAVAALGETSISIGTTLGVQTTEPVGGMKKVEETSEKKYFETWACLFCLLIVFLVVTIGPSLLLILWNL